MKRLTSPQLIVAVVGAVVMSTIGSPVSAESSGIQGHWKSAAPEAQGRIFATREFRIDATTWSVVYRAYTDASGKEALFTLRVGGVYVLGRPAQSVPGAIEGVFPATYRTITAEREAGVKMFADMGCMLEIDRPKALITEPCGFIPSLMSAMGEYDLVAVKEGYLHFGDRSGDLTRSRPTTLTPFPLIRQ